MSNKGREDSTAVSNQGPRVTLSDLPRHTMSGASLESFDFGDEHKSPDEKDPVSISSHHTPHTGPRVSTPPRLLKQRAEGSMLSPRRLKMGTGLLLNFKDLFSKASLQGRGVTKKIFQDFVECYGYSLNLVPNLFDKIDYGRKGEVNWDQFCTFVQLQLAKADEVQLKVREAAFHPGVAERLHHADPIVSVSYADNGSWYTISMDSNLSHWGPKGKLRRHKRMIPWQKNKTIWVTCIVVLEYFKKLIITTGERKLKFYAMRDLEPLIQIVNLSTIPLCSHGGPMVKHKDHCIFVFGDQEGTITILRFTNLNASVVRWRGTEVHKEIQSISLTQTIQENAVWYERVRVHNDFVVQVRYYPETDEIVSCSKEKDVSLAIAPRRASVNVTRALKDLEKEENRRLYPNCLTIRTRSSKDQSVFKSHAGVSCFDYSHKLKKAVTGGLDCNIRVWNIYWHKRPSWVLQGHHAYVQYIFMCPISNRIYSISSDKVLKVWDLREQVCTATVPPHEVMVQGSLRNALFHPSTQSLVVVGRNISFLTVRQKSILALEKTHKGAVTCFGYNPAFNQVVSASSTSDVSVWNLDNGYKDFEFTNAHGDIGISSLTFDAHGRRLITVGRDGCGKIWNYHNGQCLHVLPQTDTDAELCTVLYVDMRATKLIMTAGWSRRLNFYVDSTDEYPYEIASLPPWLDDVKRGHRADVVCSDINIMDNMIATGGSNGVVCVWSLENKSQLHSFKVDPPEGWSSIKLLVDAGVTCMTFLKNRIRQRRIGAILVSGGPHGLINFWSTYWGELYSSFFMVEEDPEHPEDVVSVAAVGSDANNDILVAGDSRGYVFVWNITTYALSSPARRPPALLTTWHAHLEGITQLEVLPHCPFVITASSDGTLRLWRQDGLFVGTFGHDCDWRLDNDRTFQLMPRDVWDVDVRPDWEKEQERIKEEMEKNATVAIDISDRPKDPRNAYDVGLEYIEKTSEVVKRKHLNDEKYSNLFPWGVSLRLFSNFRMNPLAPIAKLPRRPRIDTATLMNWNDPRKLNV